MGADLPFYELRRNGLRVHFKAPHSPLVSHPKSPNRHNVGLDVGIAYKILELVVANPKITTVEMAANCQVKSNTLLKKTS